MKGVKLPLLKQSFVDDKIFFTILNVFLVALVLHRFLEKQTNKKTNQKPTSRKINFTRDGILSCADCY